MNIEQQPSPATLRILKKRQFQSAILALKSLDQNSIELPDDVCRRVWNALRELRSARDIWYHRHHKAVHPPETTDLPPEPPLGTPPAHFFPE